MKSVLLLSLCAIALSIASAQSSPAAAPSSGEDAVGTLTVVGQGKSLAAPNTAQVSISVQHSSTTSSEAQAAVTASSNSVIAALAKVGIGSKDITDVAVYAYPSNNNRYDTDSNHSNDGYTYTRTLNVKIANLTSSILSNVLDVAVNSGNNDVSIGSIDYQLTPDVSEKASSEARASAVSQARAAATDLAKFMNVQLLGIESIKSEPISTYTAYAGAATRSSDTNVGTQQVEARVTVTYRI